MSRRRDLILMVVVWPVIFSTLAIGAYPAKILVDSYFYLSSAMSMWTDQFATHYWWIREPGYPGFLRILMALFGTSDVVLTFIQNLFLLVPIGVLSYLVVPNRGRLFRILSPVPFIIAFGTPQYMGYGAMVLKQPLLVANLALASVVIALAYRIPTRRGLAKLSLVLGVVSALSVTISIAQRYMWLAAAVLVAIAWLKPRIHGLPRELLGRQIIVGAIATVSLLMATYAGSAVSFSWWDDVRGHYAPSDQKDFKLEVSESSALSLWFSQPSASAREALEDFRSLLMLGPTENADGVKENDLFTLFQADPNWRCGAADVFTYEPYTSFGRSGLSFSCRSNTLHGIMPHLHGFGSGAYQVVMVGGLLSALYLLWRRAMYRLLILGPGFAFVAVYSLGGVFTIDRYGLPFYPFAMAGCFAIANAVVAATGRATRHLRSKILGLGRAT